MSDATLATRSLRNAPGRFATGVAIVTALDPDGQPIGLTVNSFAAVSLDPALALWCLDNTNLLANNVGAVLVKPAPRANLPASLCDISFEKVSNSHNREAFRRASHHAINTLAADQVDLSTRFATWQ